MDDSMFISRKIFQNVTPRPTCESERFSQTIICLLPVTPETDISIPKVSSLETRTMLEINTFVQCTWMLMFLLLAVAMLGKPTLLSHRFQEIADDNGVPTAETTTSVSNPTPAAEPDPLLAVHLSSGIQVLGDLVKEIRRSNDGVQRIVSRIDALVSLPHQMQAVEASVRAMVVARRGEEEAKRQNRRLEERLSVQSYVEKRLKRIEAQLRTQEAQDDDFDGRLKKRTEELETSFAQAIEERDTAVVKAKEESRALYSRIQAFHEQYERELREMEESRDTAVEACQQAETKLHQEVSGHDATKDRMFAMTTKNNQVQAEKNQLGETLKKALRDLSTVHDECQETKRLAKEASKKRRRLHNKCKAQEEEVKEVRSQIDALKKMCEPLPINIPLPPSPINQPTNSVAKPYDRTLTGSDPVPTAANIAPTLSTATATVIFPNFTELAPVHQKSPFPVDYNFNTAGVFQFSAEADEPVVATSLSVERGKSSACSSPSRVRRVETLRTSAEVLSSLFTSSTVLNGLHPDYESNFREDEIDWDQSPARSDLCPARSLPDAQQQFRASHTTQNQQSSQTSIHAKRQISVIKNPEPVPHTRYSKAWFEEWREHITTSSNIEEFAREILDIDEIDDSNDDQTGWVAQVKAFEQDMEMNDFLRDTNVTAAESYSKEDVMDMIFAFFQDVVWIEFRKDYGNVTEDEILEFWLAFAVEVERYMEEHPADTHAREPGSTPEPVDDYDSNDDGLASTYHRDVSNLGSSTNHNHSNPSPAEAPAGRNAFTYYTAATFYPCWSDHTLQPANLVRGFEKLLPQDHIADEDPAAAAPWVREARRTRISIGALCAAAGVRWEAAFPREDVRRLAKAFFDGVVWTAVMAQHGEFTFDRDEYYGVFMRKFEEYMNEHGPDAEVSPPCPTLCISPEEVELEEVLC